MTDRAVLTLLEAASLLRRPFPTSAIGWKVDQLERSDRQLIGGVAVPYLDRGIVVDRLNVVAPTLWSDRFEEAEAKHLVCFLTIAGVTRDDVGKGATPKERRTDALKRAAVLFGVGVSLMRVPRITVTVAAGECEIVASGAVQSLRLTDAGFKKARDAYEAWLTDQKTVEAFGEPLDHTGSPADALGDVEDAADVELSTDREATEALIDFLTGPRVRLRQTLGMLGMVGFKDAQLLIRDQIPAAVRSLSVDQRDRLAALAASTHQVEEPVTA